MYVSLQSSHGRDNKLCVWQLGPADEAAMDGALPVVETTTPRRQPWLFHVLDVNALNFCAFAMCRDEDVASDPMGDAKARGDGARPVLVAVPNPVDSGGVWRGHFRFGSLLRADCRDRLTSSSCLRRNGGVRSRRTRPPIQVGYLYSPCQTHRRALIVAAPGVC